MNKESKVIMKLIINKSLMVRLTFVMICLVAIVYGVYILDMPYSMYIFLQIIRILLFICVLISLIFTRVFIDKNTLSVMAFASFALIRSMLEDGDILHQILTIMTWPMIYTLFYSYTMVALKKTDEYTRETEKFKKILAAFIIVMAVVSIPLIQRNLSGQGRAGEVIFPVYFFSYCNVNGYYVFSQEEFILGGSLHNDNIYHKKGRIASYSLWLVLISNCGISYGKNIKEEMEKNAYNRSDFSGCGYCDGFSCADIQSEYTPAIYGNFGRWRLGSHSNMVSCVPKLLQW